MEFNTSFESKLEIDSNYEDGAVITSLDFAHNLQFYETLPTVNMDYRPAVDLAIQRHQGFGFYFSFLITTGSRNGWWTVSKILGKLHEIS
ncbi:hypothetical protein T03_6187 [Trichinella britovi]|uniref:Uncharacterized protein n=1 Tax=Trichinella britovi TaxID=45882 RepID=A0A0V0Z7P3_TRIBR|nr:hypothetical protein T03_6187 [Trichinella britovi]